VFYLHRADGGGPGTSWHQASTSDFVHFTEHGEMLPKGTPNDQDLSVATGSVVEHDGKYHIFYTGYNSVLRKQGKPEQGVMHAVSDDLLKWQKIPAETFFAPQDRYGRDDWRDPFVLWNQGAREYWMLVAARLKTGPSRRRGCTALCASKDLSQWEVRDPFWAPGLYFTHECPDLFRMGDWWYLVFSEFSERMQTRYRMSRNPAGPWHAPADDAFDVRALYAAKTCSDGKRRFLLGWNPLRTDAKDSGRWEWGGNLVVHELMQRQDGTLFAAIPKPVDRAFTKAVPHRFELVTGRSKITDRAIDLDAAESFSAAVAGAMPDPGKIEATLQFSKDTRGCGLMLHVGDDLDTCYYVRFEPLRGRLVLDKWPRPGDNQFMIEFERPVALKADTPLEVKVITDGSISEIYVAGQVAMSTRMYDLKGGRWGVFVEEGALQVRNPGVFVPQA
jgi:beta-fructofuranosidase